MFISKAAHINVKAIGVAYRKPKAAANCLQINLFNYVVRVIKLNIAANCRNTYISRNNVIALFICSLNYITSIGVQLQRTVITCSVIICCVNVQLAADDDIVFCMQSYIVLSIDRACYAFVNIFRVGIIFTPKHNRAFAFNRYAAFGLLNSTKDKRAVLYGFNADGVLNIGINNRAAVFNTQPFSSCANTAGRNKVNRVAGVDVADIVRLAYNIAVSCNINISARYAAQRKVNSVIYSLLQLNVARRVSADVAVVGKRYLHCLQSVIYFMPNIAAAAFKDNLIAGYFVNVNALLAAQAQVVSCKFISIQHGILRQQVNMVCRLAACILYRNFAAIAIQLNAYRRSAFNGNIFVAPGYIAGPCRNKFF